MSANENYVIDTNIIVASFSERSPVHWIYKKIENKEFDISVSNEILEEYAEMVAEFYSPEASQEMTEFLLIAENVRKIVPYYRWNLITADPDDNKFIDCAVASSANLIVTNDRHFKILKPNDFPMLEIKNLKEFSEFFGIPYLLD
jgi:putative PIN family toxin of toxin-antitoxin system